MSALLCLANMSSPFALLVLLSVSLSVALLADSFTAAQSPQSIADVRIVSVSGCVDVYPVTVNCSLSTSTLRIRTAGLPSTLDWNSQFLSGIAQVNGYSYFIISRAWPDTSDATKSTVFLNVSTSAYYPHITGLLVSLSLVDYYDGVYPHLPSAPFQAFSFVFENAPTLASISGCDGGGQATLHCVPDAAVLTLTGSGLSWYASGVNSLVNIGGGSSFMVNRKGYNIMTVVNDSYATMTLTDIYASLLKPQHYAGVLLPFTLSSKTLSAVGRTVSSYTTNALHISFVPLPPPSITQWYAAATHHPRCAANLHLNLYVRLARLHCGAQVLQLL